MLIFVNVPQGHTNLLANPDQSQDAIEVAACSSLHHPYNVKAPGSDFNRLGEW